MKEKTVERQIADAEFVSKLKSKYGDFGETTGSIFVNLSESEQLAAVFLMAMRVIFGITKEDGDKFISVLTYLLEKEELATSALLELFVNAAQQTIEDIEDSKGINLGD